MRPVELEHILRQSYEAARIRINADGTFESGTDDTYESSLELINAAGSFVFGIDSSLEFERHGKVKIDGNKLIFTADSIDSTNSLTKTPKLSSRCALTLCTFTLYVAVDRKILLLNKSPNPSDILRGYVKQ